MHLVNGVIHGRAPYLLMRKPGEWMEPVDERILELLAEGHAMQPTPIAEEFERRSLAVRYHPKTVGRRCRSLQEHGLLYRTGSGVYSITDLGRNFLAGKIDAEELTVEGASKE